MSDIVIPLSDKLFGRITEIHSWMVQNTRHPASIYAKGSDEFGYEVTQYNGLFELHPERYVKHYLDQAVSRYGRSEGNFIAARFSDLDDALRFKLDWEGR